MSADASNAAGGSASGGGGPPREGKIRPGEPKEPAKEKPSDAVKKELEYQRDVGFAAGIPKSLAHKDPQATDEEQVLHAVRFAVASAIRFAMDDIGVSLTSVFPTVNRPKDEKADTDEVGDD